MENQQNTPQNLAFQEAPVQKSVSNSYMPPSAGTVISPVVQNFQLDTVEPINDGMLESEYVALQQEKEDLSTNLLQKKSQRITLFTSLAAMGVLIIFASGTLLLNRARNNVQQAQLTDIPEQSVTLVGLGQADSSPLDDLVSSSEGQQLVVNGSIITAGSVSLYQNNQIGQLNLAELSGKQVYTFPNSSGTICLDTNNCNYISGAVVNSIGGQSGAFQLGNGLALQGSTLVAINQGATTSLNGVSGALTLAGGLSLSGRALSSLISTVNGISGTIIVQGSANQTNILTSGNIVTITTVQDIATSSSPSFQSITLTAPGTQNGNVICDISNNCGFAGGTNAFIQGGNSFGATASLGTNDTFDLVFKTDGLDRVTIDNTGNVGISSASNGAKLYIPYQTGDLGGATNSSNIFGGGALQSLLTVGDSTNISNDVTAIVGESYSGVGIAGTSVAGVGVIATSQDNYGITGLSLNSTGIFGFTTASGAQYAGVHGVNWIDGYGVIGQGTGLFGSSSAIGVGAFGTGNYGLYATSGGNTSALFQASSYETCFLGCTTVYPTAPTVVIKQNGLRTENLLEVQSSDSSPVLQVAYDGKLTIGVNNSTAPNRLIVNTLTTPDPLAVTTISTGANTNKGLIIQGVVGQSASLQEWQNSDGDALASISSNGILTVVTGGLFTAQLSSSTLNMSTATSFGSLGAGYLELLAPLGDDIGYVGVSGEAAYRWIFGATGELQWGNGAGATDTNLYRSAVNTLRTDDNFISMGSLGVNNSTAPNRLSVNTLTTTDSLAVAAIATGATTNKGMVIQGVASQAANLQEWQDSTGTILGSMSNVGALTLQAVGVATIIADPTAGLISIGGNNGITNSIDVTGGGNGIARLCLDENGNTCNTGVLLQYDGTANRFDILTASGSISAGNERLSIARDTGNTGIGTTSPGTSRLVVDNQSNTGNIFVLQDNGSVVLTVADGGSLTLQNTVDSTDAFRVMDLDGGNPVLSVDTANERVGIGTATPSETLQVIGTFDSSGHAAIGNFATIDDTSLWQPASTYSSVLTIEEEVTDHTAQYINGITNNLLLSPTVATSSNYAGSFSSVQTNINSPYDFNGTITASTAYARNYADGLVSSMYGTTTGVIQDGFSDGDMGAVVGINVTNTLQGTGDIGFLVGGIITNSMQGTGVISQAVGLAVTSDGVTNTVTDNFGIYVGSNTIGVSDYGVAIGTADTQTLWIGNDADNISANAGIAFGSSMDTNLYRSAANQLQTDGSFIVQNNFGVNNTTAPNRLSVNTLTTADPDAELAVSTGADDKKGVVVQGVTGQTANLQEWQDDMGAMLASIDAGGNLYVKDATIDGNIWLYGHLYTDNQGGGNTSVTSGAGAGTGATTSLAGDDVAGEISITTGTGSSTGVLAQVTFANPYGSVLSSPSVVITPKNGAGATVQYFIGSSNDITFTIDTNNAPSDGITYQYYYHVIQHYVPSP